MGETDREPDVVLLVLKPVPVQLVALLAFHDRVELAPLVIDVGLAVNVTVGGVTVPKKLVTSAYRLGVQVPEEAFVINRV